MRYNYFNDFIENEINSGLNQGMKDRLYRYFLDILQSVNFKGLH